jgi:ADP-ribose pyrophosphatase YjhB (NUDIX family)
VGFADPKVATSVLISHEGRVLLVKRAVVPRIGYWALPAGYVDVDELPAQTAVREVQEETGLQVTLGDLLDIKPLANPAKQGFLMIYQGTVTGGTLRAGDDVSAVSWFAPEEIPWADLAFESTREMLERWLGSIIDEGDRREQARN